LGNGSLPFLPEKKDFEDVETKLNTSTWENLSQRAALPTSRSRQLIYQKHQKR
jgi:hypothetical protein